MPITLKCHPDWDHELIKETVKTTVDAYLGGLRRKEKFEFIGGPTIHGEAGPNLFTIDSGTEFVGKFRISKSAEGIMLQIEFENSSEKAIELFWEGILSILERTFTISLEQVQSGKY